MRVAFRILVVCTGNVCRSPQAAQLIRARASTTSPQLASQVRVESAGTEAMVGSAMPSQAAKLSEAHGGDPQGHIARQITADLIRESDLVLTMARRHRSAVARLLPRASSYTFTLTEFAALMESAAESPPRVTKNWRVLSVSEKLRNAVQMASARRGYLSGDDANPVDVIDPYRQALEVYNESTQQIVDALDQSQRAAVKMAMRAGS